MLLVFIGDKSSGCQAEATDGRGRGGRTGTEFEVVVEDEEFGSMKASHKAGPVGETYGERKQAAAAERGDDRSSSRMDAKRTGMASSGVSHVIGRVHNVVGLFAPFKCLG